MIRQTAAKADAAGVSAAAIAGWLRFDVVVVLISP